MSEAVRYYTRDQSRDTRCSHTETRANWKRKETNDDSGVESGHSMENNGELWSNVIGRYVNLVKFQEMTVTQTLDLNTLEETGEYQTITMLQSLLMGSKRELVMKKC